MSVKKTYELVLFDFDGTLVDTLKDIAFYADSVLTERGFPGCSLDEVRRGIGWGVHELLKSLAPRIAEDAALHEETVLAFKSRYREGPVRSTDAFPGVREMLKGPLSGLKKAVITNKPQDITEQILARLGLASHFEKVIGMHAGFIPKPDPESCLFVMKELGVPAEKTLFIGDSAIDSETSVRAGVDFGWVSYGYDTLNGHEPAYRFKSAYDWAAILPEKGNPSRAR